MNQAGISRYTSKDGLNWSIEIRNLELYMRVHQGRIWHVAVWPGKGLRAKPLCNQMEERSRYLMYLTNELPDDAKLCSKCASLQGTGTNE